MIMDAHARGLAYLEHLTPADHDLLATVTGSPGEGDADELRRHPPRVEERLAQPALYDAVFPARAWEHEPFIGVSPFLVFTAAIERSRVELDERTYLQEWTGRRQRVPVFVTDELRGFLADPSHRLFLAELLASYTHVASGAVTVRRHGVVHRQRFSELDLSGLAGLLGHVEEEARPGLYRRLGDLALLLSGVFPDHTARRGFAPLQLERLARTLAPAGGGRTEDLLTALGARGPVGLLEELGRRWYRIAAETAATPTAALATVEGVGQRFVDARRVLNHITDEHLFPYRAHWFPSSG